MAGLRISEVAERAGVAASTVRYYERIGLVPGPARTPAGYRAYDAAAEARLLFISRAKRLGLSLEQIAELLGIWDGSNCAQTQDRVVELLAQQRAEIAQQIHELERFADQLAEVESRLVAAAAPATCDPDLSCCAPELAGEPIPLVASPRHLARTAPEKS